MVRLIRLARLIPDLTVMIWSPAHKPVQIPKAKPFLKRRSSFHYLLVSPRWGPFGLLLLGNSQTIQRWFWGALCGYLFVDLQIFLLEAWSGTATHGVETPPAGGVITLARSGQPAARYGG